jgi:hypothetical protein
MEILSLSSIVLSVLGSLIGVLVKYVSKKKAENKETFQEISDSEVTIIPEEMSELGNSPEKKEYSYSKYSPPPIQNKYSQKRRLSKRREIIKQKSSFTTGQKVLVGFSIVVLIFGILTIIIFWRSITSDIRETFFFIWLFLLMAAGMFIQVITSNYRNGKALFEVSASQLIFPLLFSIIIFYPIWSLAASAAHNAFSFYAAFLNGFFWETVVSSARLPTTVEK